ncbi:MAG: nucleoside 2-deoxyribosyltransferase [Acutalibacteraceae bacterium]|nr:nucleoside 2-deoxyribosyltransferase [Acutalibacteraceae bacterium]
MKHVYLAGPFFNETEVKNIEKAESVLEGRGFDLFSPMRHEVRTKPGTVDWARDIFEMDRTEIDRADLVVALYYGNVSDSGTAWECGYAHAKGVPVVLVHVNEDADSNLMMHVGCATNISLGDLETFDFERLPRIEYEGEMF